MLRTETWPNLLNTKFQVFFQLLKSNDKVININRINEKLTNHTTIFSDIDKKNKKNKDTKPEVKL